MDTDVIIRPKSGDKVYASDIQAAINEIEIGCRVIIDSRWVIADLPVTIGDVDGDGVGVQCGITLQGRSSGVLSRAGTVWHNPDGNLMPHIIGINGTHHIIKDFDIRGGDGTPATSASDIICWTSRTTENTRLLSGNMKYRFPTSNCLAENLFISGFARAGLAWRGPEPADQNDTCTVSRVMINGFATGVAKVAGKYCVEIDLFNSGDGIVFENCSIGDYGEAGVRLTKGGYWVILKDQFTVASNHPGAKAAISLGTSNVGGLRVVGGHMELRTGDGIAIDKGAQGPTGHIVLTDTSMLLEEAGARHIRWSGAGLFAANHSYFGPYGTPGPDCGGFEFYNTIPYDDYPLILDIYANSYRGPGIVNIPEDHVTKGKIIGRWPKSWHISTGYREV